LDAYDLKNTAGNARQCHPGSQSSFRFHSGNRAEVFIWRNFQPALLKTSIGKTEISGTEPTRSLMLSYEDIENFTKKLVVRLGNRANVKKP